MWFIADLFERYTNSVAKTFFKMTALEPTADRNAAEQERLKQRAQRCTVAEPDDEARAEAEAAVAAERVKDAPRHEHEAPRRAEVEVNGETVEMPMGVRGDVVLQYRDAFEAVSPGAEGAALVEKLRKDKRVRVAELRMISACVLNEEPTVRKKPEHLDALRARVA
ncbi:hypothetical protein L1787_19150 [Acuticoccus sp. M5D2P5]|uniref:hypothetical protein n=1 Tax=Acuticoccus kalidii TaxID=2910977 RepID=UPI001F328D5D|nr:hypothetical protein [Acuticoccus kalidii]MCF3935512.1 hypothetical protein [Acuticoccus kalidii]